MFMDHCISELLPGTSYRKDLHSMHTFVVVLVCYSALYKLASKFQILVDLLQWLTINQDIAKSFQFDAHSDLFVPDDRHE